MYELRELAPCRRVGGGLQVACDTGQRARSWGEGVTTCPKCDGRRRCIWRDRVVVTEDVDGVCFCKKYSIEGIAFIIGASEE